MNVEQNIHEELKSMGSPLADLSRVMPYSVPSGYFEHLESSVNELVKELDQPDTVPNWGKVLPYTVPQGYFEQAVDEHVSVALNDQELPGISKQVPFSTPAGYFDALPAQLLKAAKASDKYERHILHQPLKWLAAAVVVLGLGLGTYRLSVGVQQATNTEKILSAVPNVEIQDYLQHVLRVDMNRIAGSDPVNNMNVENKDIVRYLNETGWD